MLYLSLVLIFLGILIFLYSILLDAKKRRGTVSPPSGEPAPPVAPEPGPAERPAAPVRKKAVSSGGPTQEERGGRSPLAGHGLIREDEPRPRRPERPAPAVPPGMPTELNAVLYEDSSNVIDYTSESGSIDPSLEKYRKIRRLGSGRVAIEKDGISFYMGKKMYRYDFHRVRDLRSGDRHLALFIGGSNSVKLFIFEAGGAPLAAISDAYRDFVRRTT